MSNGKTNRAIFVDKDGTLIEDEPFNVEPEGIRLMPGAAKALRGLQQIGFLVVVVSNQSGVARGLFSERALANVARRLKEILAREQVTLDGWYYCPHHPEGTVKPYAVQCPCRKPAPGMLYGAAEELHIDLGSSWMIGDILNDVEAGKRAGCRTILLDNGHETKWQDGPLRIPDGVAPGWDRVAGIVLQAQQGGLGNDRSRRSAAQEVW